MISAPLINDYGQTCYCWITARHSRARIHPFNSQTTALANTAHRPQRVHSRQLARTDFTDCTAKSSLQAPLSRIAAPAAAPKSP